MALAIQGTISSGEDIVSGTTLTWSHTTNGSSGLLVVPVAHYNSTARTVSGITFNGDALTFHDRFVPGGATERVEFWYLLTPDLSTTADIVVTMNLAASNIFGAGFNFSGHHPTTPLGTMASTSGNATSWNINVGSAAGDICVDCAIVYPDEVLVPWEEDAGQTERWRFRHEFDEDSSFGSTETASGATTAMGWSRASNGDFFVAGVAVKQAPAGGQASRSMHQYRMRR